MCGINGFFRLIDTEQARNLILKMNQKLSHRGPDQNGYTLQSLGNKSLAMGHVRLSILDLSEHGKQPMNYTKNTGAYLQSQTEKKVGLQISFNGEIYNYQEIKKTLQQKGYRFTSSSDTEVILASYLEWGEKCVEYFNGMRAFVIYDPIKQKLFCSRDRLGKKPFYYFFDGNSFIFSSQLKSILEHRDLGLNSPQNLDPEALEHYFSVGYIPAPWSIFKQIKKLESRTSLSIVINQNGTMDMQKYVYYEIPPYQPAYSTSKLLKAGKALMQKSLKIRLSTSDVSVGAFLSGGLDSTSLVGKATLLGYKLKTFSIGFEDEYDESHYINLAANDYKTDHHHTYFTKKEFKTSLQDIFEYYDEPFSDYSIFPTRYLNQMAKQEVSVCISGDGGDEIFGGYPSYQVCYLLQHLRKIPQCLLKILHQILPKKYKKLQWLLHCALIPLEQLPSSFPFGDSKKFPTYTNRSAEKFSELLKINQGNIGQSLMDFDLFYNTLGDNYLTKMDRASMSTGVEVRSPFLDHRWISWTKQVPFVYKVNLTGTKNFMKTIVKDFVPQIIRERKKQGFVPPLCKWIQNDESVDLLIKDFLDKNQHFSAYFEGWEGHIDIKIRIFLFIKRYQHWLS